MPKRTWFAVIFLIFVLILSTQGVVQAKLFQLKVFVSRERLMNFELSSKALRVRFRETFQNSDDYRTEIKRNVLESAILNNQALADLESTYLEDIGMAVVNSIRIMSLKPVLHLQRDRKLLLLTKYAFFMERNHRVELAASRYEDVIGALKNYKSEILAFTLLHHGYCLASMGKVPGAIQSLERVVEKFPGTHFSQTASLLLSILLRREKFSKGIEGKNMTKLQKARSYYKAGLHDKACDIYAKEKNKKSYDNYRWGRCSEAIGKQKRALKIYKGLTKSSGEFARLANRRLLILGNFYHAGKDVTEIAQKNAIRLNDGVALKEITNASKEQREASVVKEIITELKEVKFQNEGQFLTGIDTKSLLKDIGTELVQNIAVKKEIRKELENSIAQVKIDDSVKEPEYPTKEKKKKQEKSIEKLSKKEQGLVIDAPKAVEVDAKKLKADTRTNRPDTKAPPATKLSPIASHMRVILLDGRSFKINSMEWEDGTTKLRGNTIVTYISSSSLKSIKIRRDRRAGQKSSPPGYAKVRLESGESFKTRSLRVLSNENKIEFAGKSYEYDEIEEILSLP